MASFIVMERATGARPALDGASADSVIVRDGFHLLAFLVPVLWFLFHRMWIEALAALALMMAIAAAATWAGFGAVAPGGSFLLSLLFGLEAPSLRLSALRRRGWRDWGVVEARSQADAEVRYLAEACSGPQDTPSAAPVSVAPRPGPQPALGLFGYPGAR